MCTGEGYIFLYIKGVGIQGGLLGPILLKQSFLKKRVLNGNTTEKLNTAGTGSSTRVCTVDSSNRNRLSPPQGSALVTRAEPPALAAPFDAVPFDSPKLPPLCTTPSLLPLPLDPAAPTRREMGEEEGEEEEEEGEQVGPRDMDPLPASGNAPVHTRADLKWPLKEVRSCGALPPFVSSHEPSSPNTSKRGFLDQKKSVRVRTRKNIQRACAKEGGRG